MSFLSFSLSLFLSLSLSLSFILSLLCSAVLCCIAGVNFTCPGLPSGILEYNCSTYTKYPQCQLLSDNKNTTFCEVESYSGSSTNCSCFTSNNQIKNNDLASIKLYTKISETRIPFHMTFIRNPEFKSNIKPDTFLISVYSSMAFVCSLVFYLYYKESKATTAVPVGKSTGTARGTVKIISPSKTNKYETNKQESSYQLFDGYEKFMERVFPEETFSKNIIIRFVEYLGKFHPIIGTNPAKNSPVFFKLSKTCLVTSHFMIVAAISIMSVYYTSLNNG